MGHRDDGLGDGGVVGFGDDVGDEGAVDLEPVDRESLEVGQAGVAGTEVVHRQLQAEPPAFGQHLAGVLGVAHHQALGELQVEVGGGQAGLGEGALDGGQQVGVVELAGRQVDAHRHPADALLQPRPLLAAGLAQHPRADRHDQAALLGDGDEPVGRHQAAVGLGPADQGLHADQLAGEGVHLGLVVEGQLAGLEGPAQAALEFEAFAVARRDAVVEEADLVAAALLGQVHGGVGVLDEGVAVGAVMGIDGDADAQGDGELVARQLEGPGHAAEHPLGGVFGQLGGVELVQHDHELVAAGPGDQVAVAQAAAQALGDRQQQLVAGRVAEGVVDVFEVVEVGDQHRDPVRLGLGAGDDFPEVALEQAAVGQRGEVVVVGELADPVLGVEALGDVGDDAQVAADLTLAFAHDGEGQAGREQAAVAAAHGDLGGLALGAGGQREHADGGAGERPAGRLFAGVEDPRGGLADQRVGRVAEEALGGGVHHPDDARRVGVDHRVFGAVEDGPLQAGGLAQPGFGAGVLLDFPGEVLVGLGQRGDVAAEGFVGLGQGLGLFGHGAAHRRGAALQGVVAPDGQQGDQQPADQPAPRAGLEQRRGPRVAGADEDQPVALGDGEPIHIAAQAPAGGRVGGL